MPFSIILQLLRNAPFFSPKGSFANKKKPKAPNETFNANETKQDKRAKCKDSTPNFKLCGSHKEAESIALYSPYHLKNGSTEQLLRRDSFPHLLLPA